MRPSLARLFAMIAAPAAVALSTSTAWSEELPALAWGKPIMCMKNTKGESVRVQCDVPLSGLGGRAQQPTRCLVAPNTMRSDGSELDQVNECVYNDDPTAYDRLVKTGAAMVPAVAEAPTGYERNETGRAYQTKFDLLNRIYLGVSWLPTIERDGSLPSFSLERAQAEAGLHISVLRPNMRSRHDIRILEGSAAFGDLELKGLLFSYDYQNVHRRPAFWLSTFLGPPSVHPINPGIGWGFRVLNVNDRPPGFRDTFDMEFGEVHLSWNPWQSNDMFSHLRLEAGGDIGKFWEDRGLIRQGLGTGSLYTGFSGAVKSRFSLGDGGLHYMFLDFTYLRPTFVDGPLAGKSLHRVKASMAYEAIFVAINDQPFSLRLAAIGSSREDIRTGAQTIEGTFTIGLRFSFWAPPRTFEPLPEFEEL